MRINYSLRHKQGPGQGITRWDAESKRWETETYMPGRLLQMYEEMGVLRDGKALPLCDHCPSHASCWLGLDARKPAGNKVESSHISLPWIGEKYGDRRITVVGVNPNEGGGLLFFPTLVRQAVKELEKGKILVNFGDETYKGTTLWHEIGKLAAELLSIWQDEFDFSRLSSADSYSYLAFTNHIKCSPLDERSRPSNEIWKNCGNTILKKELDTLRPEILMVLGRRENMYAMDHRVFDRPATWKYESKYFRFGHAALGGRRVAVLNVPIRQSELVNHQRF